MPAQRLYDTTKRSNNHVISIETTKSAKARYRRSGGQQWTPTKGQINAADLWNKQEEKIRKSREREEKKRKEAIRQAEKDAKVREQQQEMLRKGRITIEDTWGKINASQNRLHKFFGPPRGQPSGCQTGENEVDMRRRNEVNMLDSRAESDIEIPPIEPQFGPGLDHSRAPVDELSDYPSQRSTKAMFGRTSPGQSTLQSKATTHIPGPKNLKRKRAELAEDTLPTVSTQTPRDAKADDEDEFIMPPSQSLSQFDQDFLLKSSSLLMPPPPRPRTQASATDIPTCLRASSEGSKCSDQSSAKPRSSPRLTRSPLSVMTTSQLNSRSMKRQDLNEDLEKTTPGYALESIPPMSTQVLNDTILGLSSQDLVDDLDDDKENLSPHRKLSSQSLYQHAWQDNVSCTGQTVTTRLSEIDADPERDSELLEENGCDELQDAPDNYDDFDDLDVDDETLVSLAATQQLKRDLFHAAEHIIHSSADIGKGRRNLYEGIQQGYRDEGMGPQLQAGDSFAFSEVDETDLIQCMRAFENEGENNEGGDGEDDGVADAIMLSVIEKFEEARNSQPGVSCTKRSSLPWVRFPIDTGEHDSEISLSQMTDILDE